MASLVPSGILLDIVGINIGDRGRSCDVHEVCGSQIEAGLTVRIREVMLSKKESALAVYTHSLNDGTDGCRVGFLRRCLVPHKALYINKCAKILEVYTEDSGPAEKAKHFHNHGCCRAEILVPPLSPLKQADHIALLNSDEQEKSKEEATPNHVGTKRSTMVPITHSDKMKKKKTKVSG